jgi:hypothetical protein
MLPAVLHSLLPSHRGQPHRLVESRWEIPANAVRKGSKVVIDLIFFFCGSSKKEGKTLASPLFISLS